MESPMRRRRQPRNRRRIALRRIDPCGPDMDRRDRRRPAVDCPDIDRSDRRRVDIDRFDPCGPDVDLVDRPRPDIDRIDRRRFNIDSSPCSIRPARPRRGLGKAGLLRQVTVCDNRWVTPA
jgi:hypothetical protein